MEKTASNKKNLFPSKYDFNLREKLAKCYIWSVSVWCRNLDTLKNTEVE